MKRYVRLYIGLLLISIFALFLIAATATEDFSTLEEILVWVISGGGAMILAGYVTAYLLENWTAWHNFPRWVKILFPIALAGLFGFFAEAMLALELLDMIPVIVKSVILMAINWLFSQKAYAGIKEGAYGESARNPVMKLPG